ncbi:MAG: class I SAM-dependent methyltransferase [Pseudomonadota bacterium]
MSDEHETEEAEALLADRRANELRHFEGEHAYSKAPPICVYRTRRYVQPRVNEVFGSANQYEYYSRPIKARAAKKKHVSVLSIGSGNGQQEMAIAQRLLRRGCSNFLIEGLEYSEANVAAANKAAEDAGIGQQVRFFVGDFNELSADRERDVVIANQVLHHVSELEILFDAIAEMIEDGGAFLTRDVIGRNGHRAWPECRELIDRIWEEMPRRYTYSHREERFLEAFPDRDYSAKSFEGVRAQDILPLMLERFSFFRFYAFGGIVERFLNHALGPNFDLKNEDDLAFVNQLEILNDAGIDSGLIKPTQMLAYASIKPRQLTCWRNRTPDHCLRVAGEAASAEDSHPPQGAAP